MTILNRTVYGKLSINGRKVDLDVEHGMVHEIISSFIRACKDADGSGNLSSVKLHIGVKPIKDIAASEEELFEESLLETGRQTGNLIISDDDDPFMPDYDDIRIHEFIRKRESSKVLDEMIKLEAKPFEFSDQRANDIRRRFINEFKGTKWFQFADKETRRQAN